MTQQQRPRGQDCNRLRGKLVRGRGPLSASLCAKSSMPEVLPDGRPALYGRPLEYWDDPKNYEELLRYQTRDDTRYTCPARDQIWAESPLQRSSRVPDDRFHCLASDLGPSHHVLNAMSDWSTAINRSPSVPCSPRRRAESGHFLLNPGGAVARFSSHAGTSRLRILLHRALARYQSRGGGSQLRRVAR